MSEWPPSEDDGRWDQMASGHPASEATWIALLPVADHR